MTIMVAGGLTFAVPGAMPEAMAANANLFVSARSDHLLRKGMCMDAHNLHIKSSMQCITKVVYEGWSGSMPVDLQ
jgi:hypothetical protein